MEKLRALLTSRRPARVWRGWLLTLLVLIAGASHAATPLNGAWRVARTGDTPARILKDYRAGLLHSFDPSLLQRFPNDGAGSWVVIAPQPPWKAVKQVLTIYPPTFAEVTVISGAAAQTLALDDFSAPFHGHGRLAWQLPDDLSSRAPILLRFQPSKTLAAPVRFDIQSLHDYAQQDAQWLVFASACFAVMLAMVLMAICFAGMLRDVTYAWYAGYILCYSIIQGIQTGFVFHPLEWEWLSGMATLTGSAAVALSVAFASLFMIRFCELPRYAPLLRVPITALAVGMIQLVLMRSSQIPLLVTVAQILLNPLLMLGALLLLLAAIVAAIRGSRQAWFFLAGWTPLLLLTALSSAQVDGALPHIDWLSDGSLAGGAFEALVLSIGLADRTLRLRRDSDLVRVLADRDVLTNALNRRAWVERANVMLSDGKPRPIAMLFLDLDHFKQLNDCHGHHAGDRALVEVSKALTAELRPGDLLGRYGGEEFVAILDNTQSAQAMQVATRLCRRVYRLEIPVDRDSGLLSVSIGIATHREGDNVESLVERADQAMYDAKLKGRNRVCMYRGATTDVGETGTSRRLHIVEKRESDG
ncbi:GGDEF domain-containing protein [Rhodanobacter sp. AS-Z3]|uniref:sensor domain-containing diguanylate cyclase n=1 Tax=Rhodanobacter sp. AS-Z3 TaxID=3031330 RepID=UPI00247B1A00|nr:diguanylate cyclase [Rhodanobacter sp. AS-Z3]WEN16722.1 GGDEF domain-containing protein [Rhodanobacter sp. AS-Z3]